MNRHLLPVDGRISRAVKPACEVLEGRLFLSTTTATPVVSQNTATLRNGTLLVQGSDKADTIVMSLKPDSPGTLQVKINDLDPILFGLGGIKVIRAYGLGGSDKITVDQTFGAISVRTYIFGGNGHDSLTSGAGNDTLIGGRGNDLLQSGTGNDVIEGNADNDRIFAGDGRDTIYPGPGADVVNTGPGRDRVLGAGSDDQVDTGAAVLMHVDKKQRFAGGPVYRRLRPRLSPAAFNGSVTGLTPQQVRKAYEFGDLSSASFTNRGAGQTIAIVDAYHYPTAMADLNVFSDTFGLPRVNKKTFQVYYASGNQPDVDRGWAGEAALDIEWAHAIAPLAKIILVEADTAATSDIYNAIAKATKVLQPTGGVVSLSLGRNESIFDPGFTNVFRNASTQNVSFLAATGDTGGQLSWPAVDAEVLAIGGTSLTVDGAGNRIDESAWSRGGGGISSVFDLPDYQKNLTVEGSALASRGVPDVAYHADVSPTVPGVAIYSTTPDTAGNTGWAQVGGTSSGTPQWAGLVALANEKRAANGLDTLGGGQLNNYVYGIARKFYTQTFTDITTGDNTLHPATEGYDVATGWGSPRAGALIDQLATANSANPVSARVDLSFKWTGSFRRDLFQGLPDRAVTTFTGRGTAHVAPTLADFIMDQGPTTDPVTGDPLNPPDDQIDISALSLDRIGNTIVGRGSVNVLTFDGYPASMLVKFEGRLFRNNGQDKIIGKFYGISRRGKILAQGAQAIFRGEFSSPGAAKP